MERGIKCSSSASLILKKPERKVTEKNRRNQMKFLYSHLFSLIPPHLLVSKGGEQVSDRVDRAIEYIQSLKTSLEMSKNKKEKLSSRKRSYESTTSHDSVCRSLDIQIHEMGPDLDIVLVTGLKNHSKFCDVIQVLGQYSTEVALASFSSSGHSTFHVRHKKIEAEEMSKRLKIVLEGSSNIKELGDNNASSCNQLDSNLSLWDFDFQSNYVWEWESMVMPRSITS